MHDNPDDVANTPSMYTASVNPPRRAKRMRTDDLRPLAPAPSTSTSMNAALSLSANPGFDENDLDDEDEMQPYEEEDDVVPPPRRRGRKPSTVSRAARESQRRQNHSRIEKARRTKINDALAALRHLVPGQEDAEEEEQDTAGKKRRQEKEFKLEVLERTVVYVQELQERVRVLEAGTTASAKVSSSRKRRQDDEETAGSSDDREFTPLPPPLPPATVSWKAAPSRRVSVSQSPMARASNAALSAYPSPLLLPTASNTPLMQPIDSAMRTTSLPSISSWLGHVPPSPSVHPERSARPIISLRPQRPPTSLPTPPTSGSLGPIACSTLPPTLALELPSTASRESFAKNEKDETGEWTPEDESAASLLLKMRTSPRDTQAQTPSSLLGMDLSKTQSRNIAADARSSSRRG
ncbi:hypothetical protein PENSPDRAFT_731920 [Peniophora sp. CONT]|nr:hypothetical protein PENSPDRAFT_731920 [Peniophora sp. CONT]